MTVQTEKTSRRRRKAPRANMPAIVEQREPRPFIFGWGSHLTRHQREALKERIALFGGIVLAVIIAGIVGWGWLHDNVIQPGQVAAANSKPVAIVGSYTIRMGFFKAFESSEKTGLNGALTQIESQVSQLQSDSKKNAGQIASLQAEEGSIQQQLGSLATGSLQALIDDQAILQGASSVGIKITPSLQRHALTQFEGNLMSGSSETLSQYLKQNGFTQDQLQMILTADALKQTLQTKLQARVPRHQVEVRASHILVAASKHSLAVKLYHEALSGANFAQLAKKYSTDPGSAKKGGDLGYFTHGQMVPVFDKAAFSMKVGQVRLVKSQYGWHIIKLTGRKTATLSKAQYQQAQSSALQNWLSSEEAKLHVQRLIAVQNLPGASSTPATNPLSNINTTTNTQPIAPKSTKAKTGKTKPKK